MIAKILMVDDEPNVLSGYRRSLRGNFTVQTATSGAEGLVALEQAQRIGEPFPVIVSDMKMPAMDGAEFLSRARILEPDAIQMLLSGQADLESTIAAVNNGSLFRFLTKPCATPDLELALAAAIQQYELVHSERELLERTLTGAVDVLTQVLAMASPHAFHRTRQIRELVSTTADRLKVSDWRLPLAAMLSQIGCLAVPPDVLRRARTGGQLTDEECEVYRSHPQAASQLLARIPRLEEVSAWIERQPVRIPGVDKIDQTIQTVPGQIRAGHGPSPVAVEPDVLLQAVLDFLSAMDVTTGRSAALRALATSGRYPEALLAALNLAAGAESALDVLQELTLEQVRPGMVLDQDVETLTGMTLVRKGEEVTHMVAMRLANFGRTVGVKEPIRCWASAEPVLV